MGLVLNDWNDQQLLVAMMGIQSLLVLLLIIFVILLSVRLRKIRKQFNQLARGSKKENLEAILERLFDKMNGIEMDQKKQEEGIQTLAAAIGSKKGNVGIVRFNAFANEGSDLSFSVAVLDDAENGYVMTSIYGREESRIYAKPIGEGKSVYHLTDEEKEAMDLARKKG